MCSLFNRKQQVQKILLNSLYGVLLLPSFRFYDRENGESVTLTGQTLVKFSSDIGNYYYRKCGVSDRDNCIYQDTDSCFFEALPIIHHRYGSSGHSEEFLVEKTLEIAKEVETFINNAYSVYANRYHNLKSHTWRIKQEMVGKSAFWRDKKKRYAMWIINKDGLPCDELEVKGFDSVRSDFPKSFREFMNLCIDNILRGKSMDEMNKIVKEEKIQILKNKELMDILLPVGVKELSKYKRGQKGTPIHVKSAQNYNHLLDLYKIESLPKIEDGDKIVWAYLLKNPYGFESLAIRGYDDPPEIVQFLNRYIDKNRIFEDRLLNKLQMIWNNLGWGRIVLEEKNNFF